MNENERERERALLNLEINSTTVGCRARIDKCHSVCTKRLQRSRSPTFAVSQTLSLARARFVLRGTSEVEKAGLGLGKEV